MLKKKYYKTTVMIKKINKSIKYISFSIAILSNLFYIDSCRGLDNDKIINVGGVAAVKINLLGSEYANSDKPGKVASINENRLNVDNGAQRYSFLVSPSSFISANLSPAIA
ncbi:TPA: hypothetical protein ACGZ94_003520, partial [Elizabethkingia anophelis]